MRVETVVLLPKTLYIGSKQHPGTNGVSLPERAT